MSKYRISLNILHYPQDDEPQQYVVIHTRKGRDETIFRGTLDECQNYAEDCANAQRIFAAEQDWERF